MGPVIPAEAGIQGFDLRIFWTPAYAGVTNNRSPLRRGRTKQCAGGKRSNAPG